MFRRNVLGEIVACLLGVIDRGVGQSHLSVFTYNRFGELAGTGTTIAVGVAEANGVAILSPPYDDGIERRR